MQKRSTSSALSTDFKREAEFQFYPTPRELVWQLIGPYSPDYRTRILEPSAGRGDIADVLKSRDSHADISCCEISADHRAILANKGYKIIGVDFMTLKAPYKFNLIIMNPPFRYGVSHVLRAWDMLDQGGKLAAILPVNLVNGKGDGHSPALMQLIELFGEIEAIRGSAFRQAERKADATCCIIRLSKPAAEEFDPFRNFAPNMEATETEYQDRELPITRDRVKALVLTYERAMDALRELREREIIYEHCVPASVFPFNKHALTYAERVDRAKTYFWDEVFKFTRIGEATTSKFREDFMKRREQMARMEFSEQTIYEVLNMFVSNRDTIMEECITAVFRELTKWSADNVVASDQWKTNKGWKLNRKVIIPNCFRGGWFVDWAKRDVFDDLDKAMSMVGSPNGVCTSNAIQEHMKQTHAGNYADKFVTPNFEVRCFLKGTVHLKFLDQSALDALNQYAAERQINILGTGR